MFAVCATCHKKYVVDNVGTSIADFTVKELLSNQSSLI